MHMHCKILDRDWIQEYAANQIVKFADTTKVTVSMQADEKADVNVYWNWHGLMKKTNCDVSYFTHYEDRLYDTVLPRLKKADGVICMSTEGQRMVRLVVGNKIPTCVIPLGTDDVLSRKIVIGMSGRPYETKRKREDVILEAVKLSDKDCFSFFLLGPWSDFASKLTDMNVEVSFVDDAKKKDTFYQHIDYYLNAALDEGGPIGTAEAYRAGVPVISAPVGYAFDLGVEYTFVDASDLVAILKQLSHPMKLRIAKSLPYTWKIYSQKCIEFCKKVVKNMV
jgi:glycosyltransferase involved in cell wall biosynthesis